MREGRRRVLSVTEATRKIWKREVCFYNGKFEKNCKRDVRWNALRHYLTVKTVFEAASLNSVDADCGVASFFHLGKGA